MAIDKLKRANLRRKYHVRKKVVGTADRPRLTVFRSNRHIYVQIIDDIAGATLASSGTMSKSLHGKLSHCGNIKAASAVGESVAKEALKVGIQRICFDRNGYRFHGRVKALAESAKKAGLVF